MILQLLSYVGILAGLIALVLSIATVLYYISEQLEAHTVRAKRYIKRYIYFVMSCFALLWLVDGLPLFRVLFALFTNYLYLAAMRSFPVVDFRQPLIIGGLLCTVVTHLLFFYYFNDPNLPPQSIRYRIPDYDGPTLPPFGQIATFFGLLVWTVPLLLFLSLSANEQVLPFVEDGAVRKARPGLAKQVLQNAWQWALEALRAIGVKVQTGSNQTSLPL